MNEEILKLAKECGIQEPYPVSNNQIKAFYRLAYNKGNEDAARECEVWAPTVAKKIRKLEIR